MIRRATTADIPRLVQMGVNFLRLYYASKLEPNTDQMETTARALLDNPKARVLVAENGLGPVGMLGFVVVPHYWSGEEVATELFWWVEAEHRGKAGLELLHEAERQARDLGAKQLQMVSPSEPTSLLYHRLGYERIEENFLRRL